jgi:polar amino acid transport system substrate-binding protein
VKLRSSFPAMLSSLDEGLHDGAIANISITADRESYLDFSHPIFEGGIGVLLLDDVSGGSFVGTVAKFFLEEFYSSQTYF